MQTGDKLLNGHIVVAYYNGPRGAFVLARPDEPFASQQSYVHKFATWRIALNGETFHGNYHRTQAEAWEDFNDRIGVAATAKVMREEHDKAQRILKRRDVEWVPSGYVPRPEAPKHPSNIETEMLYGKTQSMGIVRKV